MPSTLKRKPRQQQEKHQHPWYNKAVWYKHIRPAHLRKEPICLECKKQGKLNQKNLQVDHIKEWKTGTDEADRWQLFTDMDNLQTLCISHHRKKTLREHG